MLLKLTSHEAGCLRARRAGGLDKKTLAGLSLIALSCGGPAHGQGPQGRDLVFEAVSIKPAPAPAGSRIFMGTHGGPGTNDPTLFTTENFSLSNLLETAFSMDWYRISAPTWTETAKFNIAARVPSGASKPDLQLMLQNMLVERFGLKFHHETKEVPGYELVVLRNGARFAPSAAAPARPTGELPPGPSAGPPVLDKEGFPVIPSGSGFYKRGGPGGRFTERFTRETMEKLADEISGNLGRPVKDATGLKGEYDFMLRWVTSTAALDDADAAQGPTIFVALQQQLGLKLVTSKAKIDILVVDEIHRTPVEN